MNYFEFNAKKQGAHVQEVHGAALPAPHDPTVTAIRNAIRANRDGIGQCSCGYCTHLREKKRPRPESHF